MNGFSSLKDVAVRFKNTELRAALERGKRYLKIKYQVNCSVPNQSILSHCPEFALSDSSDSYLQEMTNISRAEVCNDCFDLSSAMAAVRKMENEHNADADTLYDIEIAIKDIYDYVKHLMRDCKQRKAKSYAFDHLDEETAFFFKDFCQKVLPTRFREGQKEYFGKE